MIEPGAVYTKQGIHNIPMRTIKLETASRCPGIAGLSGPTMTVFAHVRSYIIQFCSLVQRKIRNATGAIKPMQPLLT